MCAYAFMCMRIHTYIHFFAHAHICIWSCLHTFFTLLPYKSKSWKLHKRILVILYCYQKHVLAWPFKFKKKRTLDLSIQIWFTIRIVVGQIRFINTYTWTQFSKRLTILDNNVHRNSWSDSPYFSLNKNIWLTKVKIK